MSFKPEVEVMNEPDKWHRNGLVFATREEADANARDLMSRWTLVVDCRAVEVDEPVNYRWTDKGLVPVEPAVFAEVPPQSSERDSHD